MLSVSTRSWRMTAMGLSGSATRPRSPLSFAVAVRRRGTSTSGSPRIRISAALLVPPEYAHRRSRRVRAKRLGPEPVIGALTGDALRSPPVRDVAGVRDPATKLTGMEAMATSETVSSTRLLPPEA